jgi:putative ABC transport system ATP-binding protein
MSAPPAVIEARGIRYAYQGGDDGKQEVLHGVDATFHEGEVSLITGPSGSGKTTFISLIGALRRIQEGTLTVQGDALHGLPSNAMPHFRRRFGFVFQNHNLVPSINALQNVMLSYGVDNTLPVATMRERAHAMLTKVGLAHRIHHRPDQLSTGQKQRIAIARALVRNPKMILADEPTASLDSEAGREIAELLRDLADQGATVLIVTHDNRIFDIADRLITMIDGRIASTEAIPGNLTGAVA